MTSTSRLDASRRWNQTGLPTSIVLIVLGVVIATAFAAIYSTASSFRPTYSPAYVQAKTYYKRRGATFEYNYFKNRETVRHLDLSGCLIDDDGLLQLAHIGNLSSLSLKETSVTDLGMEHLGHQRDLIELDLSGTALTDNGLARLQRLRNIRSLDVTGTRVTQAGVRLLQAQKPGCQITWGGTKQDNATREQSSHPAIQ